MDYMFNWLGKTDQENSYRKNPILQEFVSFCSSSFPILEWMDPQVLCFKQGVNFKQTIFLDRTGFYRDLFQFIRDSLGMFELISKVSFTYRF